MSEITKTLWSVEDGDNIVVAAGIHQIEEGGVTTTKNAIQVGEKILTDTAIEGLEQQGSAITGGLSKQLFTRIDTTTLGWVDREAIATASASKVEGAADLGSITVNGATFNIPDSVIAHTTTVETENVLTGLTVANVDYKIASVEANPEVPEESEDLTSIKIGEDTFKVSNPILNNAIENKGIGYIDVVPENEKYIIWDGDTTGKPSFSITRWGDTYTYYKISDLTPDAKDVLSHYSMDTIITISEDDTIIDLLDDYGVEGWCCAKTVSVFGENVDFSIISCNEDVNYEYLNFKKGVSIGALLQGQNLNRILGGTITTASEDSYFISGDDSKYEDWIFYNIPVTKVLDTYIPRSELELTLNANIIEERMEPDTLIQADVNSFAKYMGITDTRGLEGTCSTLGLPLFFSITHAATAGTPELPTETGFWTNKSELGSFIGTFYIKDKQHKISKNLLELNDVGFVGEDEFLVNSGSTSSSIYVEKSTDVNDVILIYPANRDAKTFMDDNNAFLSDYYDYYYGCHVITMNLETAPTSYTEVPVKYVVIKTKPAFEGIGL